MHSQRSERFLRRETWATPPSTRGPGAQNAVQANPARAAKAGGRRRWPGEGAFVRPSGAPSYAPRETRMKPWGGFVCDDGRHAQIVADLIRRANDAPTWRLV